MSSRILIFALVVMSNLASCQSTPVESPQPPQRVAMVSVTDSSYTMSASKNLVSWKAGGSYIAPSERISADIMKPLIESAISNALQAKGYQFVSDPDKAQLLVSYVAGLETELSDADITQRFGVMPGFQAKNPDKAQYEKGSIIVDIVDVGAGKSVWRGAIQGFASVELSDDERRKRLEKIMSELIAQFPGLL